MCQREHLQPHYINCFVQGGVDMYFSNLDDLKVYAADAVFSSSEQLMIMVGDRSADQVNDMIEFLNQKNISFFGGIFPGLIIGNKNMREGFIVEVLQPVYSSLVMPFMMRFSQDRESLRGYTAIVFVDGLSGSMKDLTDTLYGKLGNTVTYVGSGAGFYDLQHRPCIFNSKQLYKDALYVCIVKNKTELAVEHGWNKLDGPFFVKGSRDNILSDVDNYSAFELYRSVIEEEEKLTLFKEDFFVYAKDHPFGILEDDGSLIVRDPISVNDNDEIVCVAGIPEGSEIYILKGDTNTLLEASLKITVKCRNNAPDKYLPLLFDCISRAMFLEDRFSEELDNIQASLKYKVEGALSIGEIATRKNGEMVIRNKSSVLAIMGLDT
jgi:hypothetical protein